MFSRFDTVPECFIQAMNVQTEILQPQCLRYMHCVVW